MKLRISTAVDAPSDFHKLASTDAVRVAERCYFDLVGF